MKELKTLSTASSPAASPQASPSSAPEVHEAHGSHLLLTLSGCDSALLDNEAALRKLADAAATATGATVLAVNSHKFSPQGVTVLVMLAESHASLHTYPESSAVFWDCFTCGTTCRPELSTPVLQEALNPRSTNQQLISRGADT